MIALLFESLPHCLPVIKDFEPGLRTGALESTQSPGLPIPGSVTLRKLPNHSELRAYQPQNDGNNSIAMYTVVRINREIKWGGSWPVTESLNTGQGE